MNIFDFIEEYKTGTEEYPDATHKKNFNLEAGGNVYNLEINYDLHEKKTRILLYRNQVLLSHQEVDLSFLPDDLPLEQKIDIIFEWESKNLNALMFLDKKMDVLGNALDYNRMGAIFLDKGFLNEAKTYFQLALKKDPNLVEAYRNLSTVYLKLGMTNKTIEFLQQALRGRKKFADLQNYLGWAYLQTKNYPEAHKSFEKAIQINPEYQDAHLNLALCYLEEAGTQTGAQYEKSLSRAIVLLKKGGQFAKKENLVPETIADWETATRVYLVLKDQRAKRDSFHIQSVCDLYNLRFRFDFPNLDKKSLEYYIKWLTNVIKAGRDYPDLRNHLGIAYLFYARLFGERGFVSLVRYQRLSKSPSSSLRLTSQLKEKMEESLKNILY